MRAEVARLAGDERQRHPCRFGLLRRHLQHLRLRVDADDGREIWREGDRQKSGTAAEIHHPAAAVEAAMERDPLDQRLRIARPEARIEPGGGTEAAGIAHRRQV